MTFYRRNERHLIENYELAKLDNFKGWVIHHRLEFTIDGKFAHSSTDLKRLGMYYNRPHYELIYLRKNEHTRLHNTINNGNKGGYNLSNETKKKISEAMKGRIVSDETKKKLSLAHKGKYTENQRANHSHINKGKTWRMIDGKRVWSYKEPATDAVNQ